ncbi:MAG: type II toxin-antitoxin system VapC family toxin [Dehalococcoidia bacterium]|nr:type II toxin-antitoxin system VapC family toxin [Dehalococcoidia bacterium]
MVAPPLLFSELTSVLRRSVFFDRVPPEEADRPFDAFMRLPVKEMEPPDLQPQAWALAKRYDQHRAYDAQYLSVATRLGCELWTGDRKLVNAVNEPWVNWVGDYQSGQEAAEDLTRLRLLRGKIRPGTRSNSVVGGRST